jgi:excisionase family DNA binding protein
MDVSNAGSSSKQSAVLLDVNAVAEMLTCSPRHVYRLSDCGEMPRPVKVGRLVRWRRKELEDWIADGCPRVVPLRRPRRAGM